MNSNAWYEEFARLVEESRKKAGKLVDERGDVLYEAGDRARQRLRRIREAKA